MYHHAWLISNVKIDGKHKKSSGKMGKDINKKLTNVAKCCGSRLVILAAQEAEIRPILV
jgi:hypothetical protein